MTGPTNGGRVRLGGRTAAFDRMIAAACALATGVLTCPIGAARIPESSPAHDTGGPAMVLGMAQQFALGRTLITPAARECLALAGVPTARLLARHATGDWGEVCPDDAAENAFSVIHGFRVISRYTVGGEPILVLTEADRSATTILLRSEY